MSEIENYFNELKARRDIKEIVRLTSSWDNEWREGALRALADLDLSELSGEERNTLYPMLIEILHKETPWEWREGALRTLADLNPSELKTDEQNDLYPILNKALDSKTLSIFIAAVKALGKLGSPYSARYFFSYIENKTLGSRRDEVQNTIVEACKAIGEPAIDELAKLPEDELAARALGEIGGKRAYQALVEALRHFVNKYRGEKTYISMTVLDTIIHWMKRVGVSTNEIELLKYTLSILEDYAKSKASRPISYVPIMSLLEPPEDISIQSIKELLRELESKKT